MLIVSAQFKSRKSLNLLKRCCELCLLVSSIELDSLFILGTIFTPNKSVSFVSIKQTCLIH